jgi:DinB superfamily
LTPAEIADVLEESGRAFVGTLRSIPPAVASWHPKPGEWCVNECTGHVIEAEKRGFAGRIRIILGDQGGAAGAGSAGPPASRGEFPPQNQSPELPGWDRTSIAHARKDCEKPPADLADELSTLRAESVAMIRALRPEQLDRGGNHADVGRLTVNDLLHEWVHHDGNHLRQALANVQAYVWADMGNAQRFSTG